MKKPLAITFLVEEKEVRKAMAILTGEALSDEELETTFFTNSAQIDIEIMEEQAQPMVLAFVALIADSKTK
jgi:hypothetical protein